ncbi:inositol-pentakisphosphate 2-kinase-like [Tubulanus polymorphus]|uniref:inositol-pentakisphosphate 2-kinase-like n=1 Tax=Tubulanus polymorphus TaxID=672921 RepID=UPI003DA38630
MDDSLWCGEICYRAEGGKGLVVSVKQESRKISEKTHQRFVYRFLKRTVNTETNKDGIQNGFDEMVKCVDYIRNVMMPLIDKRYIRMPKVIRVEEDFINLVNKTVHDVRPDYRMNTEVDPQCNYAFCLEDATDVPSAIRSCPTIAIEIKPKTGFLPLKSAHIRDEHQIRRQICKFQIEQRDKVKKRRWKTISNYCPIDLFSGDVSRMTSAMRELVKCPQNNLRLFWSEKVIFSQEDFGDLADILKRYYWNECVSSSDDANGLIWSVDDLIHVTIQALLMDVSVSEERKNSQIVLPEQKCLASKWIKTDPAVGDSSSSRLPSGCVLSDILHAQMFDDLDIEGIFPLYQNLIEKPQQGEERSRLEDWKLDGPYPENWLNNTSDEYAVRKAKEYLASATAKDCSVMIAVRPKFNGETADVESGVFEVRDTKGTAFLARVSIIDLDIKPTLKIPGHLKLVTNSTKNFNLDSSHR